MSLFELQGRSGYSPAAIEYLHLLMGEWQVLADLGFGDVHLTVPEQLSDPAGPGPRRPAPGAGFMILGHVRPGTAVTLFPKDQIGLRLEGSLAQVLRESWRSPGVSAHRNTDQHVLPSRPSSVQAFVTTLEFEGQAIAQLSLLTDRGPARGEWSAEQTYREAAGDLLRMAGSCRWPQTGTQPSPRRGNPRVGDGMIRLREDDTVSFMSPNAISAVARLGAGDTAIGQVLTSSIGPGPAPGEQVDEELMGVLRGRVPSYAEMRRGRSVIMFRSIPLRDDAGRLGAVLLCRDVSELRRRERELSSKDATIRETHHRVKNSLQAVSAVLRMQSRRTSNEETRRGFAEAMRRLDAVSMVHETLSHTPEGPVDFDEHFSRQIRAIAELASTGQRVETRLNGSFGQIPGQQVTPMALVLNEVLTNAVEHGLRGRDGTIEVTARRHALRQPGEQAFGPDGRVLPATELMVTVADDGAGLEATMSPGAGSVRDADAEQIEPGGLGSLIVRTLVRGELDGSISWRPGGDGGTVIEMTVPLYEAGQ